MGPVEAKIALWDPVGPGEVCGAPRKPPGAPHGLACHPDPPELHSQVTRASLLSNPYGLLTQDWVTRVPLTYLLRVATVSIRCRSAFRRPSGSTDQMTKTKSSCETMRLPRLNAPKRRCADVTYPSLVQCVQRRNRTLTCCQGRRRPLDLTWRHVLQEWNFSSDWPLDVNASVKTPLNI